MDRKKEELISIKYQIEKTDVNQQRLEDRFVSITNDLKKSKNIRNVYFVFIIILISILTIGGIYVMNNTHRKIPENIITENQSMVKKLMITNDSLKQELNKIKSNITTVDAVKEDYQLKDTNIGLSVIKDKSNLKFEKQYCYINKVHKRNGVVFIEADFIEFFKGKKAVQKAKEYGDAEFDINKSGDTLYFLYNNYYIKNKNPKLRILELDDRARVKANKINQISKDFSIKALNQIILDRPIFILKMNNSIVYEIIEQKLP